MQRHAEIDAAIKEVHIDVMDCLWLAQIPKQPETAKLAPKESLNISVPINVSACISVNLM